jgi:hypothetical protein
MTMTFAQFRARTRRILDDSTSSTQEQRWSVADIDQVMPAAQSEAIDIVSHASDALVVTSALTTTTAGVLDLTAVRPLRIVRVQLADSTLRLTVPPSRVGDETALEQSARPLIVSYVPGPIPPSADGDPFVWGASGLSLPQAEELVCVLAALMLKPTEGEELAGLRRRRDDLVASLTRSSSVPSWVPMTLAKTGPYGRGYMAPFMWQMSGPSQLQLVR